MFNDTNYIKTNPYTNVLLRELVTWFSFRRRIWIQFL